MPTRPSNIEEYKQWLKDKHRIDYKILGNYYESVGFKLKDTIEKTNMWTSLLSEMLNINDEYYSKTGYPLFVSSGEQPKILIKPYDSFLFKTYRKNVLNNPSWEEPPENGWILPANWFIRIKDVVRTTFVVKYLDGVSFLVDKINALCASVGGVECSTSYEAREEGYYAAHLDIKFSASVPNLSYNTVTILPSFEIQVTTQLQEVIKKLLHNYYAKNRKDAKEGGKWQWDYKSDEFSANYLGHILHYVEGMIVDVREKQAKEKK